MMFTVYQKLIWYQENRDRSSGKDQNWLITVYTYPLVFTLAFIALPAEKNKDLILGLNTGQKKSSIFSRSKKNKKKTL